MRAFVVGQQVFSVTIAGVDGPGWTRDWRVDPSSTTTATGLDASTRARLIELTSLLGLRYAAIDLIVAPSGDVTFLEVNPGGQWGFVEPETRDMVTHAILDELCLSR